MSRRFCLTTVVIATLAAALPAAAPAQDLEAGLRVVRIDAGGAHVTVQVGKAAPVPAIRLLDARGDEVDARVRWIRRSRGVDVEGDSIYGLAAGEHSVLAIVLQPGDAERTPPRLEIPVTVVWPPVTRLEIEGAGSDRLYAGTSTRVRARAYHADGTERPSPEVEWAVSDPSVATVTPFGDLTLHAPGPVRLAAAFHGSAGDVGASTSLEVRPFPAVALAIGPPVRGGGATRARTGDVLAFTAVARDRNAAPVPDLPVTWSYTFVPDDSIPAPGAAGEIRDGRFVGEEPGVYTILASAGPLRATRTVKLEPRDVVRQIELEGQGRVASVHTSDLWVYEGTDGRDYAITGTWGGDGWAYFWDVTDPASPVRYDSLKLDARTVNDVKVSPDGTWAALSREGASNRRNGVVVLDLSDPRNPTIASVYDEGLTGGVHNMFAENDRLYALSAGDKYVILDMSDITAPRYLGEYNHPNSSIHDVWVANGIAWSSEWGTGVVAVDVGNGRWGGSARNPVLITTFPVPTGATHAAYPYYQESTGKTYLFLGDEILRRGGLPWAGFPGGNDDQGGAPSASYGYIHIVDFTDPENPEYVARYEADEFGTHNIWVEDDVLYQAYYEGGLRIVDVSGELMGDLRAQGREIAVFKPFDPNGFVSNAPNVWGPQPYKGRIFFSDFNSGLWSVRLVPRTKPAT